MCTIKFIVGYTPDLILEWFSCFLHPWHLSGSSCGLVKTWSPALGCRALQYHFHPSKGPCSGNKGIYRPLANSAPALVPPQFLRQSSFPLGRAHGMGHLTWNWNAIASACSGNLVCESTAKRMRCFWWSHVWIGSASLCFSQYKCWLQERPLTLLQWRRGHRSRKTSRKSSCSSSSHFLKGLLRWLICTQWSRWCCSGLTCWEM